MTRLYPEQLATHIKNDMRSCYLLSGNDPLLLQESQACLQAAAHKLGFDELLSVTVDSQIDWSAVFTFCQELSLFSTRKILVLDFAENAPNAGQGDALITLTHHLHDDIFLLIKTGRLTRPQENSLWYKSLKSSQHAALVLCQTPEQDQLPRWLTNRAKSMSLTLDEAALQLLCFYYEGNLLALSQVMTLLSLLYPDGQLTLPRVEQAVDDTARFTVYHLADALLAGKNKRSWHILQQLRRENNDVLILLRVLQKELIQLLEIQQASQSTPIKTIFDQKKIWQTRRPLILQALQRLSRQQLKQAIALLVNMELIIKQDYGQSIWQELEALVMLICGKPLPFLQSPSTSAFHD